MLHLPFSSLVSLCAICLCFRDHLQASYRCKLIHFAVGWRLHILFSDCSFFLTWWCSQRIFSLENRTCNPLVVLHGGPGLCHNYLVPFYQLTEKYGSSTINSTTRNRHTSRKSLNLLDHQLVHRRTPQSSHFNIQDGFDLAGHFWGGMLAFEFEVRRQPEGEALDHY